MKRHHTIPIIAVLALIAGLLPAVAQASHGGGQVQLSEHPAGPYEITVITSPSPARTGTVKVSTMVQPAGSSDVILDARVRVSATPAGEAGAGEAHEATQDQSIVKFFYAADLEMPTEGPWQITVTIDGPEGEGQASFEIDVQEAGLFGLVRKYIWLLVIPPAAGLLWWLFSGRDEDESAGASERAQAASLESTES